MPGTDYEALRDGFEISGKKVVIVFLFKNYWRKHLRNDYRKLVRYHRHRYKNGDPNFFDLKFYNGIAQAGKRFPGIPYEYFRDAVRRFLVRATYEVLRDDPTLVTSTGSVFEIQIKVIRVPDRSYYAANIEDISDTDHAYLEFNGFWLLNTIVLPWIATQRIDYKLLYKFMQHELGHCREWVNQLYRLEDYAKSRIAPLMRMHRNYSLFFLYLVSENLRVEGVHEFADKRDMQRIDVHMEWIRNFRMQVEELITRKKMSEATEFFEKNLDSASHQSTYYVGRLMAQTIALAVAKKEGYGAQISIQLPVGQVVGLQWLNDAMSRFKAFYISQLPDAVYLKAKEIMQQYKYRAFIQLYEWACNLLGISMENRIVTWVWFDDLKKRATSWYRKHTLKDVQKRDFVPTAYAGGSEQP
ncbi:TPA: hypothetical protein HA231_05760 [Candidatus Woesearchaeota archaeon]|nr:hypothetical protein [Candidatus Woesearchaeota archaeon]